MKEKQLTFQEFVNRWFGFEIDIMDISETDEEMLTELYQKEVKG